MWIEYENLVKGLLKYDRTEFKMIEIAMKSLKIMVLCSAIKHKKLIDIWPESTDLDKSSIFQSHNR